MQSKNKKAMTADERRHVETIKSMPCGCCGHGGISDAHELIQGDWFTSIPVCTDCHTGSHNGIHGRRAIWNVQKKTEMSVLNDTIRILMKERRS